MARWRVLSGDQKGHMGGAYTTCGSCGANRKGTVRVRVFYHPGVLDAEPGVRNTPHHEDDDPRQLALWPDAVSRVFA